MKKLKLLFFIAGGFFLESGEVFAHEVYVLTPNRINSAINTPSFSLFGIVASNLSQFVFWTIGGILTVFFVFWLSRLNFFERLLEPIFMKLRLYATFIARITIGLSFLAGAYYQATYGPELPLAGNFGSLSPVVTATLVIIGLMTTLGFYARAAAFVGFAMYAIAVWAHGIYMLTYVNYLGELIVLMILGSHNFSLDNYLACGKTMNQGATSAGKIWIEKIGNYLAPRSFAILRVFFGVALIYASFYAKIIHNNLALGTINNYHLDKILGFEPHFLVLGAALVEIAIGSFFILGMEIRFTALFLLFWLTLSLIFFGEVVWPHLILIGIPIAFICWGYDDYSLDGVFFRKKKCKPVF